MRVVAALLALCASLSGMAADRLSIAVQTADAGTTVRVPVRVQDNAGTLLDEGDGPDHEIQSFAFQVLFPAAAVDGIGFDAAGVTAGKTAFFSQVTPGAGNVYVLKAYDESSNPLAFTLNAVAPGDVIGELVVLLDPGLALGTAVPLQLQTTNAALIDDSATESETVANGHLLLQDGLVVIGSEIVFANGFE